VTVDQGGDDELTLHVLHHLLLEQALRQLSSWPNSSLSQGRLSPLSLLSVQSRLRDQGDEAAALAQLSVAEARTDDPRYG
jgi:hypothetical protein